MTLRYTPLLVLLFMFGATAPAAAQWENVDCGVARLNAPNQTACQRGSLRTGDMFGHRCAFEQWNVGTRSASNHGYARLHMRQTGTYPRCYVYLQSDIANAMKQSQTVAQSGTGWSDAHQAGDISYASFSSARGEKCMAFAKLGPRWQGGNEYSIRGWICGNQGNDISVSEIQAFASGLILKLQ